MSELLLTWEKWLGVTHDNVADPVIWIVDIHAEGVNQSGEPFELSAAYVRSNLTDECFDMAVRLRSPVTMNLSASTRTIPAGASFFLSGDIPPAGGPYLTNDQFKDKFGDCSIIINGEVVKRFSVKDIDECLA